MSHRAGIGIAAFTTMALTISLALAGNRAVSGQPQENPGKTRGTEFVVESYYKAKWGKAEEFLRLYKKNHLPVLRKLEEEGRILRIDAVKPRYHATEDSRWDYRVTLTFRDSAVAFDPAREEAVKKQLFPDQEAHRKAEQRRFEILDSHWDVVVDRVELPAD